MRTAIAALGVALLTLALAAPTVQATPTEVNVRIEGRSETLFEGPLLTDGHNIRAASDAAAPKAGRRCNGLNNGANPTPGPTPTAAAVDAMAILGEGFDGKWYAEPFEDYFIKRWGPDEEDLGKGEHWGLIVNNVFTSLGGCQYQLDAGDEALWAYDAFDGRPRLVLYPGDYAGGPLQLTATATLNQPFAVEVDAWSTYNEGSPPASPTRSTTPYAGAEVAPVTTDSKGFQKVDATSSDTVVTGADGRASISFTSPGWQRIKAVDIAAGTEVAIRSNRLYVCVLEPSASDCGPPPADAQLRTPPPVVEEEDEGPPAPAGGQGKPQGQGPPAPGGGPADAGQVRLQLLRLDRSRLDRGLVRVSWKVIDAGPGVERWSISSKALGHEEAAWVRRASGSERTSATLRLPGGATHRLRLTVVDALGRSSTATLGRARVPG